MCKNDFPMCTCGDTACPNHPTNHSDGCTRCIKKNLELGEIPSCFFNAQKGPKRGKAYFYRDFAETVAWAERPEEDTLAALDSALCAAIRTGGEAFSRLVSAETVLFLCGRRCAASDFGMFRGMGFGAIAERATVFADAFRAQTFFTVRAAEDAFRLNVTWENTPDGWKTAFLMCEKAEND